MSPSRRAFLLPALALTLASGLGALAPRVALAQAQAPGLARASGPVWVPGSAQAQEQARALGPEQVAGLAPAQVQALAPEPAREAPVRLRSEPPAHRWRAACLRL